MNPADLEREIHELVQRARAPRAPETLRLKVMAEVRAPRAWPWYRRSWFAWPLVGRTAAVVAALVLMIVGVDGLSLLSSWAVMAIAGVGGELTVLAHWEPPAAARWTVEVVAVARAVWRSALGPVVFYAAVLAVAVGGAFSLCAAVLARLVLGPATA
jgi:hypothetical protein